MNDLKSAQNVDHLIFTLSNQPYALPYHNLVQVIDAPRAVKLPTLHACARGTIDFLGEMIMLYDTRKILGGHSLAEEVSNIIQSLQLRKQDHLNWLSKLKDEVYHDKDISVQTDPHKCAFGRWYDTYKPESISLAEFMRRFDAPHKRIHHLAVQARKLITNDRKQQAKDMINAAEHEELASLLKLFNGAEVQIRELTFEYAIVIENAGSKHAISVDALKSFERFDEIRTDIPPMIKRASSGLVHAIGRRTSNGSAEDVLILDAGKIITSVSEMIAA